MARLLIMAICILVVFTLPRFTNGRAVIDHSRSTSNTPEDFPDHEQGKTTVRGSASIPVKSRQKRLSDQRLAELEALITLSLLSRMLSEETYKKLDPATIGRRRRATTKLIFPGPIDILHLAN